MPIYEYLCVSCSDHFEIIQKMNDRPLRKCKKCSGKLEKQVSRAAFQLKGDGWFASGYSKNSGGASGKGNSTEKSSAKPDSTDSKSKKDSKSKSSSGSDTKGQLKASSG